MKNLFLLIALFCCINFGYSQNFNATLTGNPVSTTGWNYATGVSSVSGSQFVLTPNLTTQAGYIYYNTPTNLTYCASFTATFTFQITTDVGATPADGLTFFYISNPPTGFTGGGSIGMPNNPNGLVLIFDTYDNNSTPANNPLISLRSFNGTGNYVEEGTFGAIAGAPDNYGVTSMLSGLHTVTLTYNSGQITVVYDGSQIMNVNYPITVSNGYFGFTAGTGALKSRHAIQDVSITGNFPPNPPTVTTSTYTYCQGATPTQLTATGAGTNPVLLWYTTATGGTGSTTAPTPNTSVPGTVTYYVAQQGTGSCESIRVPITVNVIQQTPTPGGTLTYNHCVGDVHTFALVGSNILWYTSATGGVGTATAPVVSTSSPGTFTYYVTQTVNGCTSNRVPVTVNVGTKPAPPTITTPVRYCAGDAPVALTAVGQSLLWYSDYIGGIGSGTPPVPNTQAEDTLTWWVTQTNNGCESIRSRQDVIIYYKPNGIVLATSSEICQYDIDTFIYYGNARPGAYYDWHVPYLISEIIRYGQDSSYIVARFDSAGQYAARMQVSQNICTSDEFYFNITVKPQPYVKLTFDKNVCQNDEVEVALNVSSPGVDFFDWTFAGAQILYGQESNGPYGVKWTSPGDYEVSVTGTTASCPSKVYKDTIHVNELPIANILKNDIGDICTGDTLRLSASNYTPTTSYVWAPTDFFGKKDTADILATIRHKGYVYLTVTDTVGCISSDSAYIDSKPCCTVTLPNAFTPNADGRNDVFRLFTNGHHNISMFRIVNRWGQTIFETANESIGWDGTKNGKPQDIGVYFYYVKYICDNGKSYEQKGEVTLIR